MRNPAALLILSLLILCSCKTVPDERTTIPADLPDFILQDTFEQGGYVEFYTHLNKAVLNYARPSHSPELQEALWIPLQYLYPEYCFPEGKFDAALALCMDTWFAQYHGMTVEDLIKLGRTRMHAIVKNRLSMEAAVEMALEANWNSGCRRFIGTYSHLIHEEIILGLDQQAGEILKSGHMLQSEQTSQLFTSFDLGELPNEKLIVLYNTLLYQKILDSFTGLKAKN